MIGPSTFVLVSSRSCQWKMLVTNTIQSKYSVLICMCGFLRPTPCCSSMLSNQRSMLNSLERSGWIKHLWPKKPHRNHLEPIEQSTDQPVLKLLHNVAHAGLEIPSTSPIGLPQLLGCLLRGQRPSIDAVCAPSSAAAKQSRCVQSDAMNKSKTLLLCCCFW